jgi:hypothetical protein
MQGVAGPSLLQRYDDSSKGRAAFHKPDAFNSRNFSVQEIPNNGRAANVAPQGIVKRREKRRSALKYRVVAVQNRPDLYWRLRFRRMVVSGPLTERTLLEIWLLTWRQEFPFEYSLSVSWKRQSGIRTLDYFYRLSTKTAGIVVLG